MNAIAKHMKAVGASSVDFHTNYCILCTGQQRKIRTQT